MAETETGLARKLAASLAEEIGWDLYDLYFSHDTICVEHGKIVVQAEDSFSLDRIRSQFQKSIRNIAHSLLGTSVEVAFGLVGEARIQKSLFSSAESANSPDHSSGPAEIRRENSIQSNADGVKSRIAKIKEARNNHSVSSASTESIETVHSLPSVAVKSTTISSTPLSKAASQQIGQIDLDQAGGKQLGLFGNIDLASEKTREEKAVRAHQPQASSNLRPAGNQENPKAFLPGAKQSMSLQSFHFGNTNHLAKAATQQVIATPGQISPLVIFGNVGCGKTHLATGLGQYMKQRFRSFTVLQLSAEQFTSRFLEALNGSGLPSLRSKFRQVDLLILEDIQFFAGKKATLIELQHTLDSLIKAGKQLILTADRHPNDLSFLSAEVQTRLVSGLLIPLNPADREARIEICQRWCAERNLEVLPEMIEWIAENINGDVRRLSGALFRVMAMQMSSGEQVKPGSAMDLLSDYVSASSTACSLSQIQKVVSGVCGVAAEEINGSRRTRKISGARMLAMFLARKHTGAALSEIGDFFGGRRHSTVLAAEKRVKSWMEENSLIETASTNTNAREVLRKIESQLRAM